MLVPSTVLLPYTLYTFTVNPGASVGVPYSFSFTTGGIGDKTSPHLLGVSPPSGTTGVGLNGPFTFQFDKRIVRSLQPNQGVTVAAWPSRVYSYGSSSTLSADGTALTVTVNVSQSYPTGYVITVDPTQLIDAFGNAGQGAPLTAQYSTFVTTDSSGPHLQASLPANGDTGVPTNVIPRLIFQRTIDTTTAAQGITLLSGGVAQTIAFNFGNYSTYPNTGSAFSITPAKLLAPNQTYSIVIGAGLLDPSGFPVQQPQTIQFTTGSGPDLIAPKVLGSPPSVSSAPPNSVVLIRTNKPIAPIVIGRLSSVGLGYSQSSGNPVPASVTLSPDGTLLTMTPQAPLSPGDYTVSTSEIVDTSGNPFVFPSYVSLNVSGDVDNTPLVLLAVNPPPGASSVPPSTNIRLLFNKTCATCYFPGQSPFPPRPAPKPQACPPIMGPTMQFSRSTPEL